MGNMCGCVRGSKEECYVDPTKAPISPAQKELSGRRYFQRRKKRKSAEFSATDSLRSHGAESCRSDDLEDVTSGRNSLNRVDALNSKQDEVPRPREPSISHGVYVGEVPVPRGKSGKRPGVHQMDKDKSRPTAEHNLRGVTKSSRSIASKDGLFEKKLLRRQLRRAASFGAVEHMLQTLRGKGFSRSSVDHQLENMEEFSKIIWDTQVHRKRRRAHTCSGGLVSQATLDTVQQDLKHASTEQQEISDIHVTGESEDMTAKERLLLWSKQMTEGYVGVRCDNFTTSWRDGRLFNAIIHKYRPDLVDMSKVSTQSSRSNLEQAFGVAEQLGVARLLDPEDVDLSSPDEKSVITYVSTLYDIFPKVPEGMEGISANDVDIKWVEFQNMVKYLSQWIKHNVTVMSDRNFPSNPVELKALYTQYLQFKENEIPPKENEKAKIKHLYKMLEVWIEFGRIQLPQGYHPNDVEKEWGKLIVAMLEREKSLRPEVDRLEMLQQIANRVQRDCVAGEDKLALARTALQSDAKRLESGIQFQNEAETAGYLLECENLLRQQVLDIQLLLDGKFYLADQLVQRVSKLRDDLLALRTECSTVYSKGRTLTSEQTKMMISGITQSLNSNFSPNFSAGLSPALTHGGLVTSGGSPAMSPAMTPSMQPAAVQTYLSGRGGGGGGGMEPGVLQQLKHMQIRKPMLKSSFLDPNLTEDEVNVKFVQDLLSWVEEMQVQLDQAEWGSDDAKRLESGIQFQNEAETAGYLLECENLLRQQVLDIQLLLDGKFYLADQLVQRVSKLRDDLLALRTECSTVYSKGRTLTSEQTKMMISGITQSLNSNFSPNFSAGLSPALTHGGLVTSGGSPAMSPAMTPSMQPAAVQTYLSGRGGGGKPMLKSSFLDPSLTEDEVHMKFVQDLLSWVEEMQVQLDQAEWGSDLPSVESNLGNHKDFHKAIEEFQMSIKEAKMSEIQMTQPLKQSYSEKLNKLESQYRRLLKCSSERQKHLDSLYDFVSRATQELIWLNEKEEEEVAFDWSERNSNISRKRDYHADLMRELDDKEEVIKSVQEKAESLLQENHPARLTIEAYRAAMQTQWSWILQLCHCVEQHLKENAVYFDFFSDAKESLDYLKSLQDAIHRKYSCDRSSSLHRLEDLIQESMDEKEQLLKYSSTVGGLVGRAKSVVQLKARNPENPIRTSIPVKSICDYRQIEITISKEDECVLVSNSHRAKWKVISPSGNEAMVPSVCFSVPPPNREATEMASRIEQLYQNALALWHHSHINMKSVVSWHYLMTDIHAIRKSTVASIKTLLPGDHEQVLSSLQSHFEDFLRDSDESEVFTVADCAQLEKEVLACKEYYEELLKSAEREEHEESVYNLFISEVRNFRMRVEGHEEQLIRKIRTPLDRDDLQECVLRITEQEKKKVELDRLKDDLECLREKCDVFLRQAAASPSVPTLSSELNILTQSTNQVYSMCCIYLEKLKTVSLVVKHSQSAEALVKLYEAKLCEEDTINANIKSIDGVMSTLKQWRSEIDERREVFHDLEDELQKARVVSERMFKTHNERDFDLDWHKEKADQLKERWQNIHSQIENRLRDLEGISKSLKYYKDTYNSLDEWSEEMEAKQLKAQENQPEDSKALAEFLNQQKVLVTEIEQKQSKIEECQKYSEQYAVGVKDYELQLMTYRAMVDSQHKSPVKRRKMQSSSDVIQQEFMDLRTRYTALVTLMTQYVKFAGETLKRAEEDERSVEDEKKEHGDKVNKLLNWMKTNPNKDGKAQSDGKPSTEGTSKPQVNKSNYLIVFSLFCSTGLQLWILRFNSSVAVLMSASCQHSEHFRELLSSFPNVANVKHIRTYTFPLLCFMSLEEMVTKKEQIGEALRTTQLMLTKHSDKMTEEEKQEGKEQLKSLHQAYSELSQQCADAASSADQALQVIQGILDVESGAVMSVCYSVNNGFINQNTGLGLLEAQLITTGLIWPEQHLYMDLEEAFKNKLVDNAMRKQLQDLNETKKCLQDLQFALEPLPVMAALENGAISEQTAMKVIEIQLATGGLRLTYTGDILHLEGAFQLGLIPQSLFIQILEKKDTWKNLIDPNTAEKVTLSQLVQRSMMHERTGLRLLPVKRRKDGTISLTSGREINIMKAMHEGIIDRETMFRLLSTQLFAGGIADAKTGRKLTVEEALSEGLIDQDTASEILSHQAQNGGIVNPCNGARLTVDEAVQCDLISSSSALLVLERQKAFMGLLWPNAGEILSFSTSLQQNIITDKLASELLHNRHKITALYIPETSEVADIDSAGENNLIETFTKELLKTIEIPDVVPDIDELNNRFSSWLVMRELQIDGSCSSGEEISDENSSDGPSPSEAKQLFISYLMMNSYMDPSQMHALQVIQGILDVESGAVMSVCYSVNNGFINQNTGLGLLEAQLITTGLIWPEQHLYMDLEDAFKNRLVDDAMCKQLQELNEAKKCLQNLQFALEPLPVITALENGAISEQTAIKIIEIQLATGGLRPTYTGDILHLERAFQLGLIPESLFIQILERKDSWKNLIDPNTAEKVTLSQLVQRSMMHERTGLRLLPVKRRKDGTISLTSGREINIMKAMHEGIIDRETMFRLLSTQLFAGGIADAKTGRKLTVEEALSEGLIDQDTASEILSHQAQNGGIVNPCNGARLTVDEAVQCDLISSSSALLVLERQKAFMGLLWPNAGEILSFSTSLQQNIITDKLASELLHNRHKITALYIPETSEVADIDSAGENNLIETFTKELLKTIEIPDVVPDIDELNNRFSSWLVMRELQIDGSCSSGEEISDENSSDGPSPSEAKQLFISYLMMNSYMDPKSGQRLLIFDWQLNKMAKLLFETSESEDVDEISGLYMNVSEEPPLNNSIPDNANASLNVDYSALGELQICESLESTTEEEHEVVNSNALQNCLKPTLPSESVVNTVETDHKCDIFLDSVEHMPVIETNKLPKDSKSSYTDKCQLDISDVASTQPSNAMQLPQTAFSIAATASSLCSMEVNPECHDASKDQEKHSKHSPLSSSETTSYTEMPSEFPHTDVVWDDKLERDYAIHLLRAQVEEGGILDVTSGKRYDLAAALDKGLIDEETVLEVLALQLQEDGLKENENAALSVLKISVSKGCISSKVALQIMEKQNLLGGFYDAAVGRTISVCDALETGLITDDLSRSVLYSEAIRKAIIDPEGKCVLSVNDAHQSGMLDDEEAEGMLHSQQNEREDIMVPDLAKRGQISLRSDEATQNSEQSADIFNQSQAGDTVVAEGVHQDDLHLPHMMDGASMDKTRKQKSQTIDSIIEIIQHHSGISPTNHPNSNERGGDPDILMDLKKHEGPREAQNWPSDESNDELKHQTDLLVMIQRISTSRDQEMLKEVDGKLSSFLECTALRDESMEAKSIAVPTTYAAATDDAFQPIGSIHQVSMAEDPNIKQTDGVKLRRYSTQNYLECVGRLQDHCDTLEDIRSDLQTKGPLAEDIEGLHSQLEEVQDIEKDLSGTRQLLEDAAFDIQNFISEHAQFLSPTHSRYLLRALSATQRSYKELMDRVFTQRQTLEVQLEIREEENQHKAAVEKQREFSEKLQELFDDLTQTENRLIGHQQQAASAKTVGDLQQYQQEHQANASALNEVISSTNKFLEENRSKLTPEQISALENKLEELKSKVNMLNQRAEESRKDLEKVLTSAIKQETETVAAVEQLEESKTKIEGLLDWISNVGKEKEMGGIQKDQMVKQNGNMPENTSVKRIIGEEDDPNGNALDTTDNTSLRTGEKQDGINLDLDQQFNRVQALQKDLQANASALNEVISSTKKFLEENRSKLTPEQISALENKLEELKSKVNMLNQRAEESRKDLEKVLTSAIKQETETVAAVEQLEESKTKIDGLLDWISNVGKEKEMGGIQKDQMVKQNGNMPENTSVKRIIGEEDDPNGNALDTTDNTSLRTGEKQDGINLDLDQQFNRVQSLQGQTTSRQAAVDSLRKTADALISAEGDLLSHPEEIQETVDDIIERYDNLSKSVSDRNEKLQVTLTRSLSVQDGLDEMMSWMEKVEESVKETAKVPLDSSSIADALSKEAALEQDMSSRQSSILAMKAKVKKFVESAEPAAAVLLQAKMEGLSQRFTDASERHKQKVAQMEELRDKVEQFEKTFEKVQQFVLKSSQALSETDGPGKNVAELSQLIQIILDTNAELAEHAKDMETLQKLTEELGKLGPEGSTALLQSKMQNISDNFNAFKETITEKKEEVSSCQKQLQEFKAAAGVLMKWLEETKEQVPVLQPNCSEQGLGTDLQKVNDTNAELAEHAKDMETLQKLTEELGKLGPEGSTALLQSKMQNISDNFNAFKETITEKKEEVSSCQKQLQEFKAAAGVLMKWLEETKEQVPVLQPNCSEQGLGTDLQKVNGLLGDWTSKAPAVQDINSKGSALCSLISVLTSPAKAKIRHNSGSAVNNSSGPGSHSYLTNQELMLVQQNMSYINNNYEHLGELLKARSSELGALLKRVLGVHDQAESLRQWMEDTKKTATSLSNHPSGKDTVKSQIEQQKVFDDNMKQKQVQLQQLRENLLRLIEEHPDSPEAEQWKHMLAQIDAGWEEVRGTMEIRKQHLEESSRMLELFQTTQPQLSQWLQEKELMMGVLGPLSVDPNMLNTQKQQVQILLKEFDSRKPQYEKLTEAATAIASASEQQDPAVEQVKEQLASVSQKWQALTGQLSQRHALIEQAVGKTTQFQELLQSLSKSATCLETELNNQQALSTQPDEVKKQIEATNTILAQLREEKKRLKEAETVCSELSAMVTEEYLRADLTKQLEGITKPFRQLEDKAGKRIEQLNSAFASSQQFHQTSKDFQAWLNQTLQEQCKPQPISANAEKLKQSLKENSAAQKAISEHEEPYNTIIKEGEALLQSTEGAEKVALQGQLSALKSSWDDVKKGNAEQAEKLQGALERALKYKEHYEKLSSWLQEVEDREKYVKLSANSVEIEGSLSQLKAIQKDVEKHRGQVVMMNAAADSLLEVVTSDGDSVREEKAAIGKKVDKLTEDLTLKRESLENISQKLKEFNDLQKEAKGQLEAARKQLDSHSALGVQAYSNKNLTNMNAQQNSLEGVHNQIEHLKNVAKSLVVDASEVEGVTDLLLQADSLEKDHMSITKKVEDACSTLEDKLQGIGQFQNSIREMFANFTDLDDEFDGMAPVGRDLDTLGDQQSTIKHFIARLQDLMTNTANGRDSCKKMLESEASPDHLGLKRDLETLGKQCGKLMDRATGRREQVEETLSHLEEFYVKAQEFTHKLSSAEKQEESQGSVGLETEVINQQLESFKVFQKDIIESLQSQLQELNTLGQALIQNAAKGTSTKKLDHDLVEALEEEVLGHGKILYQAMSLGQSLRAVSCADDKELVQAKLDITHSSYIELQEHCRQKAELLRQALANAQLFGEDEVALMTWLDEVHGKLSEVSIQDYTTTVLSKQHAEQLALHEDIELRKQNIEQAVLNGLELLKQTTGDEVVVIQGKLDGIKTRYSEINTMSNNVSKTLDKALSLATKLQNTHEELNSWLEKVESELATFTAQEPVGEQLTHLQERQKTLMKEVKDQKPLVDSLNEVSSALLELVPWRAREGLDRMVTDDNERYRTASDAITQHVDQTGAAILKSQQFEQAATTELEWLTEAERKLSCLGDVRLEPEQTTAQLQAQKSFSMDIMRHKDAVDAIVKTSEVIMNSKDEAEKQALRMKLQTLSEKYNVVSQLNSERCLQLERAHSLASQFWETYDELWPWLQETRTTFTQLSQPAIEYEALRQQQEELRQMRELIAEHKPHIDKMNKTGPQLVELSPTEGLPIREKYETSEKLYSQLKVNVKHRAAALDEAISKSTQFHDKIDPMLESLERIAERLRQPPSISVEVEKIREQISENKAVNVDLEKLQPSYETLMQRGEEMIARSEGADKDLSAKAVQDKLDQMVFLWNDIQALLEEREAKLLDVMDLAEKFWCDHCDCFDFKGDAYQLQIEMERLNHQTGLLLKKVVEEADRTSILEPMNELKMLWENLDKKIINRQHKLEGALLALGQFQHALDELLAWLTHTEELLNEQRKACGDPKAIEIELAKHHVLQNDVLAHKTTVEAVNKAGSDLIDSSAGEEARGLQNKLENLNQRWRTILEKTEQRRQLLDSALLQSMFDSVDIMEGKLDSMSPVGTDLETVKQQIEELKEFKGDAYQLQIEMERLNHQTGLLLKKVVEEADRTSILEPMNELKMLWENLDKKIINRQHKLEGALLALGQFQHALDELLAWLTHTEELLNEQRKACGDPKAIEIELAKHHVLQNDVLAHKTTVEAVNKAGSDLIDSSAGEEARGLQNKLENLNQRWRTILEKTEQRRQLLDSALLQAQGFHGEIEDMQRWLKDTERQLLASKALGGLPETAREQLNTHLELCSTLEAKEEIYKQLLDRGQQILALTPEGQDSTTELDLRNLQEKWECVQTKVTERKVKLEEALAMATDFHNSLQDFINWLTQAEQTLTMVSPASLILETVMFQIDEHKVFVTEVNSHRDQIIELDKTGTHLKYFSQKQDVVLIKNLLLSVQGRWEKVVQRSVERGRLLDDARKRAKQFHETWNKLMEWLEESERALDSELEIANDPDKIKMQLSQHKEFQKTLGSKHSVCDTTSRTGRALKDKTSLQDDNQKLDDMLSELRDKWDTVCGKSVERQNKLEEALLFSGQFTDALQALIDWLYKVEPQLAEDQPVHGDIDLVLNLIDSHKVFQKELGKRTGSVQALKRSARELIESSHDDSSWVKAQMQELSTRWETVCSLSVSKQTRLEQALCQAEEFHSTVHILLEWLAEAEQSLRFHGALPDDEEALRALIEQHKEFMKKLEEKRLALNKATSMGEAILSICHPDSITTIKHWNTIIKARFEEVTAWARQHQQRLSSALAELLATQELLENLLNWLKWAETTLGEKDKEPLPQELEEVKSLIAEHQTFMEEMTRNQPDVDKITKTHKRKATADPPVQSQIPILGKGRTARKRSPTQSMYTAASQAQIETKNPRVNLLVSKWQQVWLLALDRRRKLNDALDRLEELKEFANFDFDVWRKRYMRWMNHKKSRVMDFFRRIDKDQDGKVTRQEFIDGILSSKFPTSRLEMSAVADIFDRDGDGYIDYYEFVAALHPNKDAYKPLTDADKIEDEVTRQVAKCKCPKRFQVEQIGANKYRFYLGNQFGLVHCLHDPLITDETLTNRDNQNLTPHLHVAVLESCILVNGQS
ncbi:dystonin-like [Sinocyclocheilus rhinocerous]|uniref:dystonin-like n=1 Tax=Sinocyclocheilus rhinocerous TaxID=307959 RepID=UPI0007B957D3|nr:PREDICTED: dystonin-like [Sinocyclocheilus rhinocerous]